MTHEGERIALQFYKKNDRIGTHTGRYVRPTKYHLSMITWTFIRLQVLCI